MTQTRLHVTARKEVARALFSALEAEFEEDGFPLAITEMDESAGLEEVSLYVDGDADEAETRMLAATNGLSLKFFREKIPDIDWVAKSLEGLKPVRAGRFLVHGSHDRGRLLPSDIGIEIEAGQAFGTGHHGTTSGCLELIEDVVRDERPVSALDLGAGSAVLAIAIAKLATIPVLATDIDPVAVEVAVENIRLNVVSHLVEAIAATGFDHPAIRGRGPFDLIVANILAGPLMELAPAMAWSVEPGGSVILSGILERQGEDVIRAYAERGFRHVRTLAKQGWVTLHLKL